MKKNILLFDTTLRDGAQMTGISFSARDKIAIAKKLDELRFDYIEGGFPGSNPKDSEFFELAEKEHWKYAKICAFGATRHKKNACHEDKSLIALRDSGAPVCVLFGKSSRFHAEKILETSAEENLCILEESVRFLVDAGKEVIFDAEHFFDGFFEDREYAIECLRAAARGGAINLTLADTNGGMLPEKVTEAVSYAQNSTDVSLGIHAHNDSDLAVANTLAAVNAGVTLIQGTINGLGERCGNASLTSVIPILQLKMGIPVLSENALSHLTNLSRFVQELSNLNPRKDLPFVGHWAFRHKGGVHVSAMRKNPNSYQHILPELVGNQSSSSVSELSGRANILEFLHSRNISASDDEVTRFLHEVKEREREGLAFDGGETSLEVLARKVIEEKPLPFTVIDFFVHTEKIATATDPVSAIEATTRVVIREEEFHTAGFGNGPVNALDVALRKALEPIYPWITHAELVDFKVRIVDMSLGTSAKTRVQIETKGEDGEIWRTVGCSQNIIAASMQALEDALIFAIWKGEYC
ncbi:citramalate synthase [Candidatus Peregrinibacteria bacterium]|nr:MAG: citramalate synthase [Candidatus Peregrinibacteria bacterium]